MKKNYLFILLALIFIIVLVGLYIFLVKKDYLSNSVSATISPKSWETFTESQYKLTFQYPSDLNIQGTNESGYALVTKQVNASGAPKNVLSISFILSNNDKTLSDIAQDEAISVCNADAPCAHASCPSLSSKKEFKTAEGISAIEIFDNLVLKNCANGISEVDENGKECNCLESQKNVGPIYFLDVQNKTNNLVKAIEIKPEILENNSELLISAENIKKIVDSVRF